MAWWRNCGFVVVWSNKITVLKLWLRVTYRSQTSKVHVEVPKVTILMSREIQIPVTTCGQINSSYDDLDLM